MYPEKHFQQKLKQVLFKIPSAFKEVGKERQRLDNRCRQEKMATKYKIYILVAEQGGGHFLVYEREVTIQPEAQHELNRQSNLTNCTMAYQTNPTYLYFLFCSHFLCICGWVQSFFKSLNDFYSDMHAYCIGKKNYSFWKNVVGDKFVCD